MNKNFPEWYRIVNLDPSSERLQDRWKGIISFVKNGLLYTEILELVKLFYSLPVKTEFREKFINAFVDIDNAFPQKNNNFELSVLAGTTLIHIIDEGEYENWDNLVLLAMQTTSFNDIRKAAISEILAEVKIRFIKKTIDSRENLAMDYLEEFSPNNKLIKDLEQVKNGATWDPKVMADLLLDYFKYQEKFNGDLVELYNNNILKQEVNSEDSQILWWMINEWSRDLEIPLKKLKSPEDSIVIGKELADLINVLPGPYASKAVLHKNLSILKKSSVTQCANVIEKQSVEWRKMVSEAYPYDNAKEVVPILTAISKSLEVDDSLEWLPSYKKLMCFDIGNVNIDAIDYAYQIYLECLVIKCVKSFED
jgi:hypothetical protein